MFWQGYYTVLDWLEQLLLPCLFKALFHWECPGCGFQRSVLLLLKGKVWESVQLYWATFPILFMFLFCLVHLRLQLKWGNKILIFLYCGSGILLFCQYIYKLSNQS